MTFTLSKHEVHAWQVPLELPDHEVVKLHTLLSQEERARADRFRRKEDRSHYIVAHATLRVLLARYMNDTPASLEFSQSSNGKPRLAAGGLEFNLSHSDGLALIAVACGREVGIDVERIREDFDFEQVSERFFTAAERTALHATPVDQRRQMFFQIWTCKESFLKASGDGLGRSPTSVSVGLQPDSHAVKLRTPNDPSESDRWSIQALTTVAGYAAAMTAAGRDWKLIHQICPSALELVGLRLSGSLVNG